MWILTAGFTLVIVILAVLAWLGLRQAEEIRRQANILVGDHLFAVKLIERLELEQHRASTLLLIVARSDFGRIDERLREFEGILPELTREGGRVLPSPIWDQLNQAGAAYSSTIKQAMSRKVALTLVEQRYDDFIRLIDEALKLDALGAAAGGVSIEEASTRLASETGSLLIGAILISLACAVVTIRFTLQSMRRIAWQATEINRVSWHLIQGQEEAARRFSHELHDELGQSLTALKATISIVQPHELQVRRGACLSLLDEAIGNVRELSQLLRPVILDDFGLPAALRWLAERFEERTRIQVETDFQDVGRLEDDVETHLYRITQEALTNVARNAGATRIRLELEQVGGEIMLTITDNGSGLPRKQSGPVVPGRAPGLGLTGMRARAEQLGGVFSISNIETVQASGGVRVAIRVPARPPHEESPPGEE